MAGIVVIKLGGGLITNKSELCSLNYDCLENISRELSKTEKKLVIIHGAGSFGHMKSKKFMLHKGDIDGFDQSFAVDEVRSDMVDLNNHVMSSLSRNGITAESFPPRIWAKGTGPNFEGELPVSNDVTVSFGDVVSDPVTNFGILSGDDIVLRYALELENVERVVFAIGGVDGLLRVPPSESKPEDLIENWHQDIDYFGEHLSDIDVTGGIALKMNRGAMIAEKGIDVLIVNGEYPERLLDAIEGKPVRGTKIHPRNC